MPGGRLNIMKIEAGKFYKTRGGEKVRIYAVDGAGVFSIHGAVLERESWVVTSWNEDGSSDFSESNDIAGEWVEPSPKLKAWIVDGELIFNESDTIVSFSGIRKPTIKRAKWLDEPGAES